MATISEERTSTTPSIKNFCISVRIIIPAINAIRTYKRLSIM